MSSKSQQLTALIEEMDAIEQLAASFQAGSPGHAKTASSDSVTQLRRCYLNWYARCLPLLNDAGQAAYRKHYSGSVQNIHRYISDPADTGYSSGSSRSHRSGYSSRSYYYWKNDYDENFRKPFNEQRLLLMRLCANAKVRESAPPPPPPPPAIDTIRLHSRVRAVSSQLFKDGHYRQAIFRACLALNEAVQERSGRVDLDGTKLMQQVFSLSNPVLKFDSHHDEQQGYMWLFSGLTMAVRNPRAHHVGESEDLDANEALELLAMISALFRALDSATKE